jgi:replicative DNA helicase
MQEGKLPPHNVEAEEAVIGSILVSPDALGDVIGIVKVKDFYREKNAWVYEAMLKVDGINQITVAQELAQAGRLEAVGGAGYLSLCVERCPGSFHAEHYAGIVARLAQCRRMISAAGQIAAIGYEAETDLTVAYGKVRQIVDGLAPRESGSDLRSPKDQAEAIMQISSDWQEKRETVRFGYPSLDRITGGMSGGDMIIVGARTTVGKSTILQEVALHNAYHDKTVLFASVEMSQRQLLERQISMHTHKDIVELRNRATQEDWAKIGELADIVSKMPLHVLPGDVTLEKLARHAKTLKETKELKLICFDHVQFIARRLRTSDTLREKVGYVTNFLKSLAEELDIPVLAACQLNRAVEARDGHKPMLADLQESGSIEQDADMVLLLHRPELYDKCKAEDRGFMFVKIAKDRQGGRDDIIRLKWYAKQRHYGVPTKEE